MIKVMLVDDQPLILEGINMILSIDEGISVVAMAKSSEEALLILENVAADLILMDIRMPGMGGVKGIQCIMEKYPATIILVLTTFDDDQYIIDALRYGAKGYLLKDIEAKKLTSAIYEAMAGDLLLMGHIARKLALSAIEHAQQDDAMQRLVNELDFTERELDIVALIIQGFTSKEISEKLYLAQGTVKNYFSNIYTKLGTNDRAKASLILKQYFSGRT